MLGFHPSNKLVNELNAFIPDEDKLLLGMGALSETFLAAPAHQHLHIIVRHPPPQDKVHIQLVSSHILIFLSLPAFVTFGGCFLILVHVRARIIIGTYFVLTYGTSERLTADLS